MIGLLVITAFLITCMGVAQAASDNLSITVTIASIGIDVSPPSWPLGIMELDSTKSTTSSYFTATNDPNSNTAVDLVIQGSNSTNWFISSSNGTDQFVLECQGGNLATWTSIDAAQSLLDSLAIGGSVNFDLQFTTPTVDNSNAAQQTITVTVTASVP